MRAEGTHTSMGTRAVTTLGLPSLDAHVLDLKAHIDAHKSTLEQCENAGQPVQEQECKTLELCAHAHGHLTDNAPS